MNVRASALWTIAGTVMMLVGLVAGIGGKPVAIYLACGTIFLLVGMAARKRDKAADKDSAIK